MATADFSVRGLELHSLYAWDYEWIVKCLDFMQSEDLNALMLHRNDFIDLIVYPGTYFGCDDSPCESIFDRYRQIFRTLYKYTPTRRSGPYQRRAFLKRVLQQAAKRGISVYVENKELYFPEIILEFYPHLVKEGKICASDPFWWDFIKIKYTEFFEEFPEIAGIITAPATGESKVSITSNRCTCERCQSTTRAEWFDTLLRAMYGPIKAAGKKLIVRDFVFDPEAHHEIASAMEQLPEDVVISLKNTPHDYYPTFPANSRIGNVGNHAQWIEFDAMGQYFGWGVGMADLSNDYRTRMRQAKEKGAEGIFFRTDWESLDGHTVFRSANLVNLYAGSALARDLGTENRVIHERYMAKSGWFAEGITAAQRAAAVAWFSSISEKTWEVTRRTPFVDDNVFSDSSLMPVSYEHAFWLAEEKNSLKAWVPQKAESLQPTWTAVLNAIAEKDDALSMVDALVRLSEYPPIGIDVQKAREYHGLLKVNRSYVQLFQSVVTALFLVRYVIETEEDRTGEHYRQALGTDLPESLRRLQESIPALLDFQTATDYQPHTIYTLLDPDRVSCLYRDLLRKLESHELTKELFDE